MHRSSDQQRPPRDLNTSLVGHLRNRTQRYTCPLCYSPSADIRGHLLSNHPSIPADKIDACVDSAQLIPSDVEPQNTSNQARNGSPKRQLPAANHADHADHANQFFEGREAKRLKSPPASPPSKPLRSRARPPDHDSFVPAPREGGGKQLWDESRPGLQRPSPHHHQRQQGLSTAGRLPPTTQPYRRGPPPTQGRVGTSTTPFGPDEDIPESSSVNVMIPQPETRPISQEQLVAEVKGIYAGLVMVESKCIEVDNAQNSQNETQPPLNKEQWQALIALHRTLLHEHHDFFLASQHPSASEALRRLANKYAMPARMWRHGIHSFLELLRHRLPAALEYMQTFIYLAYSMMALLYETVPAFEDTWIECLGDLSRYRMAIEDDSYRDREVWTGVSRHWYSKASDKAPSTGRLHHHLAILARPKVVTQLFYYSKSLCVGTPFNSARESILTLFDPLMNGQNLKPKPAYRAFVKVHSVFFTGKHVDQLQEAREVLSSQMDETIAKKKKWVMVGHHFGIANICATFEYGLHTNLLMRAVAPAPSAAAAAAPVAGRSDNSQDDEASDTSMEGTGEPQPQPLPVQQAEVTPVQPSQQFLDILAFTRSFDQVVFRRLSDVHVLSYVHVRLFFMRSMAQIEPAMTALETSFPWALLAWALNAILEDFTDPSRFQSDAMPGSGLDSPPLPLPEDWCLRGLPWADGFFSSKHFDIPGIVDAERIMEPPSIIDRRRERILWLAWHLAQFEKWLVYDSQSNRFSAAERFEDPDLAQLPEPAPRTRNIYEEVQNAINELAGHPSEMADLSQPTEPSPTPRPHIIQILSQESSVLDVPTGDAETH